MTSVVQKQSIPSLFSFRLHPRMNEIRMMCFNATVTDMVHTDISTKSVGLSNDLNENPQVRVEKIN